MKILCSADLHIGRAASRFAEGEEKERVMTFSAATGWRDLVDLALKEGVELVLLAGDIVDWDNRYFEAYGPLEEGTRKLLDNGVSVCAVAGNHDVEALPRLAKGLSGSAFKLLGEGGKWERAVFTGRDGGRVTVDGWSFPKREVLVSPLESYELPQVESGYHIAMVHGDLDASQSKYAPIARSQMRTRTANLWLLGHIHAPRKEALSQGATFLYPGSLTALDPGETGVHGPWMLVLGGDGGPVLSHVPLSRSRYESVEIDISDLDTVELFRERIPSRILERAELMLAEHEGCKAVALRILLTGRISYGSELPDVLKGLAKLELTSGAGASVVIDKLQAGTQSTKDLKALAQDPVSPAGWLARLLIELEGGVSGGEGERILNVAVERAKSTVSAHTYLELRANVDRFASFATSDLTRHDAVRERLIRRGYDWLDAILDKGGRA